MAPMTPPPQKKRRLSRGVAYLSRQGEVRVVIWKARERDSVGYYVTYLKRSRDSVGY